MSTVERVLILYSWNDDISEDRHFAMKASPLVEHIPFEHCFALEHEGEEITAEELVQRVSSSIESFKPTVFLFHTGMAFRQRPEVFVKALPRLKERHKDLRFGYERRQGQFDHALAATGVFDHSTATRELETLFFEHVFRG